MATRLSNCYLFYRATSRNKNLESCLGALEILTFESIQTLFLALETNGVASTYRTLKRICRHCRYC